MPNDVGSIEFINDGLARRPRAGTLPSMSLLGSGLGSTANSSQAGLTGGLSKSSLSLHDPFASTTMDPLLKPGNLRRRVSGLPHLPSSSNPSATSELTASSPAFTPTFTTPPHTANAASLSHQASAADLRASLLRTSQPVSPDPVAASARLRSGSLTLPIGSQANAANSNNYTSTGGNSSMAIQAALSSSPSRSPSLLAPSPPVSLTTPVSAGSIFGAPGSGTAWSSKTPLGSSHSVPNSATLASASITAGPLTSALPPATSPAISPIPPLSSQTAVVTRPSQLRQQHTRQPSDIDPSMTLGSIMDLLDSDDTGVASLSSADPAATATTTQLNALISGQSPTIRKTMLSNDLRRISGSASVPSSSHPSMQDLRRAFNEQSSSLNNGYASSNGPNSTGMLPSASTGSNHAGETNGILSTTFAPPPRLTRVPSVSSASTSLAAATAARLRANTMGANDLLSRQAAFESAHPFSTSLSGSITPSGLYSGSTLGGEVDPFESQPVSRSLADLIVDDEGSTSYSQQSYEGEALHRDFERVYGSSLRPRATTIGMLQQKYFPSDQENTFGGSHLATSASGTDLYGLSAHRKRAGTSADVGLGRPNSRAARNGALTPTGPHYADDPLYGPSELESSIDSLTLHDGQYTGRTLAAQKARQQSIEMPSMAGDQGPNGLFAPAELEAATRRVSPSVISYAQAAGSSSAQSQDRSVDTVTSSAVEYAPVNFGDRPATPPAQVGPVPRSLWIGGIDNEITSADLQAVFGIYGTLENVRLLPERDCAFVK